MQLIEISPVIPAALARLPELAGNLSYSWHRPTRALFEDLDQALWRQTKANPRLMLRCVNQEILDSAARDPEYLQRYVEVLANFDSYQSNAGARARTSRWWLTSAPNTASTRASRSIRAASASWLATIARRPATSS